MCSSVLKLLRYFLSSVGMGGDLWTAIIMTGEISICCLWLMKIWQFNKTYICSMRSCVFTGARWISAHLFWCDQTNEWKEQGRMCLHMILPTITLSHLCSHTKRYMPSGSRGGSLRVCHKWHEVRPPSLRPRVFAEFVETDARALLPLSGGIYYLTRRPCLSPVRDHVERFKVEL